MMLLEEQFLEACKTGNLMMVMLAVMQKVDVNLKSGWGLRRAIRYNQPKVWKYLLSLDAIKINIPNENGQTALHTACRFNIIEAVSDLMMHPSIMVNVQSDLGSTPLMVAVKYARIETIELLLQDLRIDIDTVDHKKRILNEVVGIAVESLSCETKACVLSSLSIGMSRRIERARKLADRACAVTNCGGENDSLTAVLLEADDFIAPTFEFIIDEGYFTD